jgi:hypothetical protein
MECFVICLFCRTFAGEFNKQIHLDIEQTLIIYEIYLSNRRIKRHWTSHLLEIGVVGHAHRN